jgi:hypothetical protein
MATSDDDPGAALEALGHVLRLLPPHVHGEEEAFAVLPLVRGLVEVVRDAGHAEPGDRLAPRVKRSSGSSTRFPVTVIWVSPAAMMLSSSV